MGSVGYPSDVQHAHRFMQDIVLRAVDDHDTQGLLTVANAAMKLAEVAQKASISLTRRPLVINTLLIGSERSVLEHKDSGVSNRPSIYHIDVSGNFERVQAKAIGFLAGRMNTWFQTRGNFLVSEFQSKKNETSTEYDELDMCIKLSYQCIKENFPLNVTVYNGTQENNQLFLHRIELAYIVDHKLQR